MKSFNNIGFTIIETMLFFGISGMLIIGVLVGTGTSINIQRYRDSVTSLRSFLQQQYSEVLNVSNESINNLCYGDTKNSSRGQSECVILGRYVKTDDSDNLTSSLVIGYKDKDPASSPTGSINDVDVLRQYDITVSDIADTKYGIDWGSSLVGIDDKPMMFSMLILRSPSSGIIRTFIDDTQAIPNTDIQDFLSVTPPLTIPDSLNKPATICVESNGLFTGKKMAVYIMKNATSASDIDTKGDNSGCR